MKTRQTIIATSIALLLSGNAFASESRELHEHLWNQIKSYGDVLLAEDSVGNWGPWADFVEPAAGAPSPVLLPGAGGSDPYKNLPDIIVPKTETGCAAGSWCGFAIYQNTAGGRERPSVATLSENPPPANPWYAASFSLTLDRDAPDSSTGSAFWRLTGLEATDPAPTYDNAGTNIPAAFGGGDQNSPGHYAKIGKNKIWIPNPLYFNNSDESTSHFNGSSGTKTDTGSDFAMVSGFSNNTFANEARNALPGTMLIKQPFELAATRWYWDTNTNAPAQNDEVAIGEFQRRVSTYITGNEKTNVKGSLGESEATTGYYVAGIATPQAYLDAQKAGDVVAHYAGGSFDGSRQGAVTITVNFKPATWHGTWFGGFDKNAMNFEAKGGIVGASISSSSPNGGVSAIRGNTSDLSYSGSVQGTFYGQTAGSIGGISSVTKTSTASGMTTTSPTQNAIFLVNKVASVPATPPSSPK